MTAALERFEDLRRPGAAALDLAWVAEGALDGFFELALGPWDVAAGGVLIQEAAGVDWKGAQG
jgi:myo-inositol-1(or 4)-monophosphatase